MADDRVIQIAVSPGTQEFPDEVYLLYQSGAVFHGSLSEEGWKWNEVSLPQGKAFHPAVLVDSSSRRGGTHEVPLNGARDRRVAPLRSRSWSAPAARWWASIGRG